MSSFFAGGTLKHPYGSCYGGWILSRLTITQGKIIHVEHWTRSFFSMLLMSFSCDVLGGKRIKGIGVLVGIGLERI